MHIQQAVLPLRLIFFGALLVLLDFNITWSTTTDGITRGWSVDILSDLVGDVLITVALVSLARFSVDEGYRNTMQFLMVLGTLACLIAMVAHVEFSPSPLLEAFFTVANLVGMVGVLLFCGCMIRLSRAHGLQRSAESWSFSRLLFLLLCLLPALLTTVALYGALAAGTEVSPQWAWAGCLLIPVTLVPVIHLFLSTSRMSREAEEVDAAAAEA